MRCKNAQSNLKEVEITAKTVLSNPGAIGLSIAGETDQFKIIASIMMFADKLVGGETSDTAIKNALKRRNLEDSPENIGKVRSFFNATTPDTGGD